MTLGARITNTYDAAGQMATRSTPAATFPASIRPRCWSYAYDAAGNQTSVTDSTRAFTTSACDDANRLTRVIDPRGYSTTYD